MNHPDHEYERSPFSGAGNCVCGAAKEHRRHPHDFTPSYADPSRCVCASERDAPWHSDRSEAAEPARVTTPGLDGIRQAVAAARGANAAPVSVAGFASKDGES